MSEAKPQLYFAYGSNLSVGQAKFRCATAEVIGPASLEDHQLTFPRFSPRWRGGVAGVSPRPGKRVHGVLYRMSEADLRRLDGFEHVDAGAYTRRTVRVRRMRDGGEVEAWTYIAAAQPGGPFNPSARYLTTMLEGARSQGLPREAIDDLERRLAASVGRPT